MAASQIEVAAQPEKPKLFSDDPVKYIKIETGDGHIFIVDENALKAHSSTIAGLLDPLLAGFSDPSQPIEFDGIAMRAMEVGIEFAYYKKRWIPDVYNTMPEFELPPDKNLQEEVLCASQFLDLR